MPQLDRRTLLAAAAALAATPALAVEAPTSFDRRAVVEAAAKAVREEYVDPAIADALADMLLANLARGNYSGIADPTKFARALTDDLRAQVHDLHLSVSYDPAVPHVENAAEIAEDDLHPRFTGWGVQTVARLPGNVGLLRVTHFPSPPTRYAERYAGAMALLQDTSALVLDLTTNHGGGTDTMGFFLSYFLEPGLVVSRSVSRREPPETIVTSAKVPGPKYGTVRPMFVAISGNTFSAGESVTAQLRQAKRAVLMGRRTRGGAHMGNFFKLPDGFQIFIVTGKGLGRDWEGVGIEPDIGVEPEFAVAAAHRLAVEALLAQTADAKTAQVLRNVQAHAIENLSSFAI